MSTPQPSFVRPQHYSRARLSNKYSPLNELLFKGDGEGESWDQLLYDNSMDYSDHMDASQGFYSPAASDQFIATARPNRNWEALVEEPPFQS
ncbi:hypothetical protein LguiB_020277 [Lonicera macranthoides]